MNAANVQNHTSTTSKCAIICAKYTYVSIFAQKFAYLPQSFGQTNLGFEVGYSNRFLLSLSALLTTKLSPPKKSRHFSKGSLHHFCENKLCPVVEKKLISEFLFECFFEILKEHFIHIWMCLYNSIMHFYYTILNCFLNINAIFQNSSMR